MGSRGATDGRERQRPSIGRDTGSHSVDRSDGQSINRGEPQEPF
jgi:hypothetical protein